MSVGEPSVGPPITELQLSRNDLCCMSPLPAFPVRVDRLSPMGFIAVNSVSVSLLCFQLVSLNRSWLPLTSYLLLFRWKHACSLSAGKVIPVITVLKPLSTPAATGSSGKSESQLIT